MSTHPKRVFGCMSLSETILLCVCVYECTGARLLKVLIWRSEDNLLESVSSFCQADPRDRTQVASLGSKLLLSRLASP